MTAAVQAAFTLLLALYCVTAKPRCRYNQFTVKDVLGNTSCIDCPTCPKGQGLSPDCGSSVAYGTHIECKPCIPGGTYSEGSGLNPCSPCGICSDHQDITKNCTLTSNTVCAEGCNKGFYLSEDTGDCQPCSWCCGDTKDRVVYECRKPGIPPYQQCDVNRKLECKPKCDSNQNVVVGPGRKNKCSNCRTCPVGTGLTYKCGSILNSSVIQTCTACELGISFSDKTDSGSCTLCRSCSVGQTEERRCSTTSDRICGKCDKGFYQDTSGECEQCSHCCGDAEDIVEDECIYQGMPAEQRCRYTLRSVEVCQKMKDKNTSVMGIRMSVVISLASVLCIVPMLVAVVLCCKKGWLSRSRSRTYRQLDEIVDSESAVSSQQNQEASKCASVVEKPESYGSPETLSFDKSGVRISFCDPSSYEEHATSIGVEICLDPSLHPKLDQDEMLLSPVIKLHPHGQDLTPSSVQVKIPHSASRLSPKHGWCIEVRQTELTSCNSDVNWTVPVDEVDVDGNEVGFEISKLLAFAVVGRANISGGPVKKRMKCTAFAGEPRVGEDFTITLVLLDDCESSFEEVMHTEKLKGKTILGAIQSLHIEAFRNEDVKITVQDVSPGWTLQSAPKDITYEHWSNSFLEIPKEDITFHHADPSKREFHCRFDVCAGNDMAEVSVYTYFQEDPTIRRHQTQETQQGPHKNQEEPVVLDPRQPSPPLFSLPPKVLDDVCRLLDMPLRKVGHWRHVAQMLNFSPEEIQCFGKENLKPDGSPTTLLLQALSVNEPGLTVGEFVHALQIHKRNDIVQVLRPFLYSQQFDYV